MKTLSKCLLFRTRLRRQTVSVKEIVTEGWEKYNTTRFSGGVRGILWVGECVLYVVYVVDENDVVDECTCTICHLIRRILAYSLDLSVSRDGLSGHRDTF